MRDAIDAVVRDGLCDQRRVGHVAFDHDDIAEHIGDAAAVRVAIEHDHPFALGEGVAREIGT